MRELAEREGTGVVRVVLNGGDPITPVLAAHAALPRALRDTARMAIAIHLLRLRPSITLEELAEHAQEEPADLDSFVQSAVGHGVLKPTANPRPGGVPAWRLDDDVRATVGTVLPYFARPAEESVGRIRLAPGAQRTGRGTFYVPLETERIADSV